jgi:hypothetical protein
VYAEKGSRKRKMGEERNLRPDKKANCAVSEGIALTSEIRLLLATCHRFSKVRHAARLAHSQLIENKRKRTCYPETHFALATSGKSECPAKDICALSPLRLRAFEYLDPLIPSTALASLSLATVFQVIEVSHIAASRTLQPSENKQNVPHEVSQTTRAGCRIPSRRFCDPVRGAVKKLARRVREITWNCSTPGDRFRRRPKPSLIRHFSIALGHRST